MDKAIELTDDGYLKEQLIKIKGYSMSKKRAKKNKLPKMIRMTQAQMDRLVDEASDLQDKVIALDLFLPTAWETISAGKNDMLRLQKSAMETYLQILICRIKSENDEEHMRLMSGKKPRS